MSGGTLPDFSQSRTWDDHKPRLPRDTKLLLFFDTACESCMVLTNEFIAEARQREDLTFVGITEQEPKDVLLGFPPDGPVFQTVADPEGKLINQFPVYRLPATVLVDGDKISEVWFGADALGQVKEALVERLGPLPEPESETEEEETEEEGE